MKKFLLACLCMAGLGVVAQTPRLSLYEEFTGETCPPCAATNPGLNALLALPTNTTKIVAIKWQVPIPSAPTKTWSLYQTNKTEIDWRWKSIPLGGYGYNPAISSAPSSKIDGQEATTFGAASGHPVNLTSGVISTAQSYTSAFSITMTRAWDPTFTTITLTVNITASANFTAVGPLIFRTVMVEKHIHFATQPGTNGERDFEDAAIKSFPTLQNGVAMASNWTTGQTQSFTLSCPLPSYVRDKAEVAFVGFIQDDGNQKVAQAVRADPQMVSNDAKAMPAGIPIICTSNMSPTITVKNNGANTISSFDVSPFMNGAPGALYNWSGSLAAGASTNIVLSNMTVNQGTNTFSYSISNVSGSDNNLYNNSVEIKFLGMLNYQGNPVAEGFTGSTFPPANFYTFNTYGGATWIKSNTAGGFGLSTQSTKLDLYSTVPDGSVNELHIPAMHVGTLSPMMWFDVAYAQYTTENDKLEVLVSDNCGASWNPIYTKSGAALATAPVQTSAFTPSGAQWRQEIIPLGNYANQDILVKFVATSDYGNNMYLDNINLRSCLMQTVTASSNREEICVGETTTLTASGAGTYSWSSNTQATGAALVVSPASSQTYIVSSADETCFDASASVAVIVNSCTGIAFLHASDLDVNVYPNPAKGETNITIYSSAGDKALISIVNTLGQLAYKEQVHLVSGEARIGLDLKTFPAGIYTIMVDTEKGSSVKKLTVSK